MSTTSKGNSASMDSVVNKLKKRKFKQNNSCGNVSMKRQIQVFNQSESQTINSESTITGEVVVIKQLSQKQARSAPSLSKFTERSSKPRLKFEENNKKPFLEAFLYPMSQQEFFQQIWKQKAYACVNAPLHRIENIMEDHMFDLDLQQMLENTASETIFVWMRSLEDREQLKKRKMDAEENGRSITQIDSFELEGESAAKNALICYNGGGSLYFRSPQEMADIFVTEMSHELGMNFAAIYNDGAQKGEIEVFVSRKGHVTDWHFDFMENFTIQLSGSKKWKLMKSTVPHPLRLLASFVVSHNRGCTPHYKGIDTIEQQLKIHQLHDPNFKFQPTNFDYVEEVTLTPGSTFYFPAGMWHKVECTEDSISINISLIASSYADIVAGAIHQILWSKEEWRSGFCASSPQQARQQMANLLSKLKDDISVLKAEDVLPNSIFYPRNKTVEVSTFNEAKIKITESSKFRRNPLAVIVETEGVGSIGSEDSDDEGEFIVDSDEDEWHDVNSDDEKESPEEENSERQVLGKISYSLHINFGNEELSSAVVVKLIVDRSLVPAMNWMKQKNHKNFSYKDIKKAIAGDSNEEGPSKESLKQLIQVLCYNGYIHLE